jgi:hypothetical protein
MRTQSALAVLAGTLMAAAALAGCADGPGGPTGTVTGHLEMVGGPATPSGGTPVFLVPGTITAVSGSSTFRASAASNGSFTFTLPVGTYKLTGTTPQDDDGKATCIADAPVTVRTGQVTHADVACPIS